MLKKGVYCRYKRTARGFWKSPEQRESEIQTWPGLSERGSIVGDRNRENIEKHGQSIKRK